MLEIKSNVMLATNIFKTDIFIWACAVLVVDGGTTSIDPIERECDGCEIRNVSNN